MRLTWITTLLSLTAIAPAIAAPTGDEAAPAKKSADGGTDYTTFNGQQVPPMKEMKGKGLAKDTAKGYWLVEFFSPYCHHCQAFAPVLQTAYEFYYTSKPPHATQQSDNENLNSFTRYYDFKFGKMDCVAYGDTCTTVNVRSFPTLVLYKDGEEIERAVGGKDMKELGAWIEERLESIRPGSRPKEGLQFPKPGDKSIAADAKPEVPDAKDKKPEAGASAASAHKAKSTPTKSAGNKAPAKSTANPDGKSVPLTAEKFQRLVSTTSEPWFVKFYAPWCHHCQAMGPNWAEMAREMQGQLNVGEVNCDVEKRLCKDANVHGYPTLLFFRGGERVEYNGLRGVGDLITYAKKALDVGTGVIDVDEESFEELEKTEEVLFVYFYDHATTNEDFLALDRLTLSLIGHAKLVKTKDPALAKRFKISTWPRLMVSRDGKPSYYSALAPKDMRDFRKVLAWMKTVWLPIVPELTASNSREIMDGKMVVLGILSRERSDEFIIAKREIKNAALEWIDKQTHAFQLARQELRDAKQLRIEEAEDRNDQRALRSAKSIRINTDEIERKEVGFAWVDGVFWERWIRTTYGIDVKEDGERVVINDEDNHQFWDSTITGNPIVPSRTSILETLPKVTANPPKISPKSSTSRIARVYFALTNAWSGHPWFMFAGVIGVALAAAYWGKARMRRRPFGSGGFFQLDGEKGGYFGSPSGGGKVD